MCIRDRETAIRIRTIEEEYQQKESDLKARVKKQLDEGLKAQYEYYEGIKKEFEELEAKQQERYVLLEQQYLELQQMFDERPSRPEDLELIQQLQRELVVKDEELKRAVENLKFFKLELINREENYNKMFNANPNVGVLNPLQAKLVRINLENRDHHPPIYRNRKERNSLWSAKLLLDCKSYRA
eukprot:TRINITY_DN6645_c0_g1_i3.p1 TRINITY_DN6645_c0_g1~~TRINITY_DN6645_c0_g1_i3.p1  ORF type:complete len:184 (-),score=50.60 TRINITY_DN6645_c0_g1_i3:367-918(-)